ADLVFLLAERAARLDIALVELAAEQQRVMLLLQGSDALAKGLEHRRNRRHLLFRRDEGVDSDCECRLDQGPEPAQLRTGGLIELIELQARFEIRRRVESHGNPPPAQPPSTAARS